MTSPSRILIAAFAALLILLGVQAWRTTTLERENAQLKLAPMVQGVLVAQAKVETVTKVLAAAEKRVTRTITSVRVDTLLLHPTTAADTATALREFPALAIAHDSLQRSCSAFVLTCDQFRAASEQRDTAQRELIAGLQTALKGARPSRIGAIWSKVKMPLAFAGGLYIGSQVKR